jgi:2-dehydro-3-deoxygluconokinase
MRAVFVGEAMLELSRDGPGWRLGYGGDTLNTALHLARSGVETAYLTAIGNDRFGDDLITAWEQEGLDTGLVRRHPHYHAGLYAIDTDAAGERSFTYWRSESAARALFACPGIAAATERAAAADLLGFSLISLAVLPADGQDRLLALARTVRSAGGQVAFDGNYRPRLWTNAATASTARDRAIACADIGLPTLEDEAELSGAADADAVAAQWQSLGCRETVVKLGKAGCRLPDGRIISPPAVLSAIDTSGAGDAFNAGYLTARLNGFGPADAAVAGHRLAAWVVMRPGAIPALDAAAPYPTRQGDR